MKIKKYTRNIYSSRGILKKRDILGEGIYAPKCEICSKPIERKRSIGGYLRTIKEWLKLKTCGRYFNKDQNKLIPTECMKKWRAIPQNNGRYLGLMHRSCKICGKTGLSYVCQGEKLPEMCKNCYSNRAKHAKTCGLSCNGKVKLLKKQKQ